MMLKRIEINLDGTLAIFPSPNTSILTATPNWDLIRKLLILKRNGYELVLSTDYLGTEDLDKASQELQEWLKIHNIEYLFKTVVIGLKKTAELYIDQRGIPPIAVELGITSLKEWKAFISSNHFKASIKNHLEAKTTMYLTMGI